MVDSSLRSVLPLSLLLLLLSSISTSTNPNKATQLKSVKDDYKKVIAMELERENLFLPVQSTPSKKVAVRAKRSVDGPTDPVLSVAPSRAARSLPKMYPCKCLSVDNCPCMKKNYRPIR